MLKFYRNRAKLEITLEYLEKDKDIIPKFLKENKAVIINANLNLVKGTVTYILFGEDFPEAIEGSDAKCLQLIN